MKGFAAAIMITVTILCMGVAQAQVPAPSEYSQRGLEIAGSFTVVRANAAPKDCGCFFMYGGNVQAALVGQKGVGVIADFGRTSANDINADGNNLTLSTYMGGVRYVPRFHVKKVFDLRAGAGRRSSYQFELRDRCGRNPSGRLRWWRHQLCTHSPLGLPRTRGFVLDDANPQCSKRIPEPASPHYRRRLPHQPLTWGKLRSQLPYRPHPETKTASNGAVFKAIWSYISYS